MSLKEQIDIVEVIQKYLTLQKRGRYFTALCPFHRETKPSFYVSPELQIFKCFGCGEGGDAIKFVMKMENLPYREALTRIAEWFGISIEKEIPKSEIKRIIELNYAALKFFRSKLTEEVQIYLKERGLTEKAIGKFEIGFSPGGTLLRDYLYSVGFSAEDLTESGLLDSQKKDRFQSRIIFPLRDENNRLLGFMGRIFPPNSEIGPKYLNTPETKLFQKSRFLYGLVFALSAIQKNKRAILVEGTLDVILAQQNSLPETIASSGTSATIAHLRKIKKYANKLVFAFDNDAAGIKSILRINPIAQEIGLETEGLLYTGAKDLAEWLLSHQIEELQTINIIDFLLAKVSDLYDLHSITDKTKALEEILKQVKNLDPIKKEEAITKISNFFKVPKEFLLSHLEKISSIYLPEEKIENLPDLFIFKYFILADKLDKKLDNFDLKSDLWYRLKNNLLTEEENEFKEMLLEYLKISEVDLEKEFFYCQNIIREKALKEKLQELGNWLSIKPEESDKILKEIKKLSEKLKKIHAQEKNTKIKKTTENFKY